MRSRQSGLFCVGERRGSTSAARVADDRKKLGAHPRALTIPLVQLMLVKVEGLDYLHIVSELCGLNRPGSSGTESG